MLKRSWYELPKYYDLAFRDETKLECDFFEAAFHRYADIPVRTVLEPACGSGRLIREMARRGYQMLGFDVSSEALRYCRERLRRCGLHAIVFKADMTRFALRKPVDAAFNTFDSFRHLLTEEAALDHLRKMVEALRPGGIYILGLHLLPPDADDCCVERWRSRHGLLQLSTTLRVVWADRRRRLEKLRINLLIRRPSGTLRVRDEFLIRIYNARQLYRLIRKVPQFRCCDVFDYWYEIDRPLKLDDHLADAVLVLKRIE